MGSRASFAKLAPTLQNPVDFKNLVPNPTPNAKLGACEDTHS